jgi:hypothetical protein
MSLELKPGDEKRLQTQQVSVSCGRETKSFVLVGFRFNVEAVMGCPWWKTSELPLHAKTISVQDHGGRLHVEHFQRSRGISKALAAAIFILDRFYRGHIKL